MLWEVEIRPKGHDAERDRICEEYNLLTHGQQTVTVVTHSARGYLIEGGLDREQAGRLTSELLVDPLVETGRLRGLSNEDARTPEAPLATVLLKPGVMDPAAQSVAEAARDLRIPVESVRTFRRYFAETTLPAAVRDVLFRKVLANDAIEQ